MFYIPEKKLQQDMARSDTEISCSDIFQAKLANVFQSHTVWL